MSKHTNHNHWNMYECKCHGDDGFAKYNDDGLTNYEWMSRNMHQEYAELKSTVLDLLQSLDAEDQLKNGFNGMGYNIVQETASKKRMHVRRLRSMIGEDK